MGQVRNDNILLCDDTNIHIGRIESAGSNLTVSPLAELLKYFNIEFSDFSNGRKTKSTRFPGTGRAEGFPNPAGYAKGDSDQLVSGKNYRAAISKEKPLISLSNKIRGYQA